MKLSSVTYFIVTWLAVTLLWSCAKTGQLTGGPKDKTPPQIVDEKSTPNFQTNFMPEEIVLYFDEFVQLKSLDDNLLISPPMFDLPDIKQRGKRIRVVIPKDEVLRQDATYSINFGSAIADFNEGNAIRDYKFVFATGDQLDSLSVQGTIKNAYTGEPMEGVLLMLYDVLSDSIAAEERPFYLVKTNENGAFDLENLRSDTFQVVALVDDNFNYMYDLDTEGIGFADSLLILTDSSAVRPEIEVFYGERQPVLVEKNYRTFGLVYHLYGSSIEEQEVELLEPADWTHTISVSQDTFRLWYEQPTDSITIRLGADTFIVKPPVLDTVFTNKNIGLQPKEKKIAPWDTIVLRGSSLLSAVDTSLIKVYRLQEREQPDTMAADTVRADTLAVDGLPSDSLDLSTDTLAAETTAVDSIEVTDSTTVEVDTIGLDNATDTLGQIGGRGGVQLDTVVPVPIIIDTFAKAATYSLLENQLWVQMREQEPGAYEVLLLPGAVTDVFGRTHDTLTTAFTVQDSSQYGSISLRIADLQDSVLYVVELRQEERLVGSSRVTSTTRDSISFTKLSLNTYTVVLIADTDGNGRWTTGDYWSKRQPEKLKRYKLEPLRANFDQSLDISWTEKAAEKEKESGEEEGEDGPPKEERPRPEGPRSTMPKGGRGGGE